MSNSKAVSQSIRPTGIPKLDEVLHGGFPKGAAVLLTGASGTGKTVLGLEWLFRGYAKYKEPGIYISFTESVSKMQANSKSFAFHNDEHVGPRQVFFTDLRAILKGVNLDQKEVFQSADVNRLIEAIINMVEQSGAKRVVIDSVTAMGYRLNNVSLFRNFIFQLSTGLAQSNANSLLISELTEPGLSKFGVEEFISDGIIKMSHCVAPCIKSSRILQIIKLRGRQHDKNQISFRISAKGLIIYPRLKRILNYPVSSRRVSIGVSGLDEITSGGFFQGSSTVITGASGTGKTTLALQFAYNGLKKSEEVLYVSFEESKDQLFKQGMSFGWDLSKYEKNNKLKVLTSYPEEAFLDEHMQNILGIIEQQNIKRVVIDSLSALGNLFSTEMLRDFTARLVSLLHQKKITSVMTLATSSLLGAGSITEAHLSSLVDNILMLRFVEVLGELKQTLVVVKTRGSQHDSKLQLFVINSQGFHITTPLVGYEGLLSGIAHRASHTAEEQLYDLFLDILGPMGGSVFLEAKANGLSKGNVEELIEQLGKQGILSEDRKEEFNSKAQQIFNQK
ncbi:MAG: circadian clock protein KaiC [Patescibacteria group bacterium]|nr:circadian clock protein KaiC [Patescibacteria group bacterium]